MKDTKNIKIIGGAAAVLAVLVIALVVIFGRNSGSEAYRNISIFELNASATVGRDGTTLDAYEGMRLENGDTIRVADNGYLRLVLDGDKYATLEAGTEIRLNATGDDRNSKTEIVLINGAVLNEIDNKLNADSSYELSTPTSVMAVRGTVFRVAMTTEGEVGHTELIVLDGQVAAAPVLADGTIGEEIRVNAGESLVFDRLDDQSDPVCTQSEISYENLPAETLERIMELRRNGRLDEISITAEELEQFYEQATGTQPQNNDNNYQQAATPETADAPSPSTAPETEAATPQSPSRPAVTTPPTQASTPASSADAPTQAEIPSYDTDDDDDDDHHPVMYTVTFKDASGQLFGTQHVVSGAKAQRPLLSPATSGSNSSPNWCDAQDNVFDFNTPITKDLTLYYR